MTHDVFPTQELETRLASVQQMMVDKGLDGLLVSVPENIYYLTGLDHWGFFAAHVLVVNQNGEMALCCRSMEKITVQNQVNNATFYGHKDHEDLADYVHQAMKDLGLAGGRIGIEKRSLFLTPRHAERIQDAVANEWLDSSGLIDDLRQVKSPLDARPLMLLTRERWPRLRRSVTAPAIMKFRRHTTTKQYLMAASIRGLVFFSVLPHG
ncbi:MAG: Xaa-Pro dipeptidase [Gammaproteobacteria bacterium]|jgi:Xaa-Pro dipeptidase